MATQTEYTVPAATSGVAVNNATTTPHMWMTPEGFYLNESNLGPGGGGATAKQVVIMGTG